MKSTASKNKAPRKSKTGVQVEIGVKKSRTSSRSPNTLKPTSGRASRPERLQRKPKSVNLQHLYVMFSSPESIRSYIYECASKVCEDYIRARTRNETLLYRKLAQELPLFITLSGASDLVNHLCASRDPVEAFIHFKANLQLEKLRRATVKVAAKGKPQKNVSSRRPRKNERALLTHLLCFEDIEVFPLAANLLGATLGMPLSGPETLFSSKQVVEEHGFSLSFTTCDGRTRTYRAFSAPRIERWTNEVKPAPLVIMRLPVNKCSRSSSHELSVQRCRRGPIRRKAGCRSDFPPQGPVTECLRSPVT